jgi:transposase
MDASPAQTAALHPKSLHSQLRYKRLESGAFKWPPITDGVMRLTSAQLAALVDGMDWSRLHARDVTRPTATS